MNALIVGGTSGIGQAVFHNLEHLGWNVNVTGRHTLNVHDLQSIHRLSGHILENKTIYDAFVFCAGDVTESWGKAFDFPVCFYAFNAVWPYILNNHASIIAVSSVAAIRPAKYNPHYAAAKAALESYAATLKYSDLAREHDWSVDFIRFDLVDTPILRKLPPHTLEGRPIISAESAAQEIVDLIMVNQVIQGE